ncbi:MAG: hypothetical protein M3384_13260 [Acidobacteriota bacterium]|nr:hypothetical protein [Acidobacteriota bacterium]
MKKKTALLIFISFIWAFSAACSAVNFAAGKSNQTLAHNTEKVSSESLEQSGETPAEEAENESGNVTGVYQSRATNHFNEFKIIDRDGNLKVEFMGLYEFKAENGMAMANTDQTDVLTATLKGDTAIVRIPDYPKCRYTLRFAGEKLTVRRDGTIMDCGLGGQIAPEGVYRKVSGKTPVFGEWSEEKEEEAAVEDAPAIEENRTAGAQQTQNARRISFKPGSSEAVVSGKIVNGGAVIYLVNARKGQTLEFRVLEGGENNDVVGEVFAPNGRNLTGEDYGTFWRGALPQSGDYKISVGTIETENTNFKIQIAIK